MPVKKDESGNRSIFVEIEVPGSPEEVWAAISTGPGITSWFMPTEVEEREGGAIRCAFAPGMESISTVTAWEPPRRYATESTYLGPEGPPLASELLRSCRAPVGPPSRP